MAKTGALGLRGKTPASYELNTLSKKRPDPSGRPLYPLYPAKRIPFNKKKPMRIVGFSHFDSRDTIGTDPKVLLERLIRAFSFE